MKTSASSITLFYTKAIRGGTDVEFPPKESTCLIWVKNFAWNNWKQKDRSYISRLIRTISTFCHEFHAFNVQWAVPWKMGVSKNKKLLEFSILVFNHCKMQRQILETTLIIITTTITITIITTIISNNKSGHKGKLFYNAMHLQMWEKPVACKLQLYIG